MKNWVSGAGYLFIYLFGKWGGNGINVGLDVYTYWENGGLLAKERRLGIGGD
jgi:hypothetical protein